MVITAFFIVVSLSACWISSLLPLFFSFSRMQSPRHGMTAFKPGKSLKREDSFLQKFSNRYGYRGLGAMGKS